MALEKRLLGSVPTAQHSAILFSGKRPDFRWSRRSPEILLQDQERSGKTSRSCIRDPDVMNGDTQLIKWLKMLRDYFVCNIFISHSYRKIYIQNQYNLIFKINNKRTHNLNISVINDTLYEMYNL